ncbi:MAG TPA: hypothetical protein VHW23_33805 [Kofleriaceae bacterium]|jgi:hypothetical protein|nr:hypothetical protein [Kofleriaceae bacterium]
MVEQDSDAAAPAPEPGRDRTRAFSITQGPLLRLLRRFHLTRVDGSARAGPVVAITWGPLAGGALVCAAAGWPPAPFLHDLSVHARLLIVVPLLLQAERILDQRCRSVIDQLYAGQFAERAALDRILDRAERLRDSRRVVLAFAAFALLGGLALQWGFNGLIGVFTRSAIAGGWSFGHLWYSFVAWPIAQLLILRWLWHWVIWSYIAVRLSRLPLATIAIHPDHAAGIGFLEEPIHGFAGFVLALSVLVAAAWETQILDGRASLHTFVPEFAAFLVVAAVLACGPLLLFVGMLYRARRRDIISYNELALDYVRSFHRKWIEARSEHEELLGTADLQSLHDLCGAYDDMVKTRLVPLSPRTLVALFVAAVVPMLPLVVTAMPFKDLLQRLLHVLLGTLPGAG